MKFIYITKPLPVFNKKFRENSGNPSSMFIYKKTGYKEKLRLLYSASFGQKMRSFVSECRLRFPDIVHISVFFKIANVGIALTRKSEQKNF